MRIFGFNFFVGMGSASLATVALMGMSGHGEDRTGGRTKQDELAPSIETLQKQLMRRFTERTNVDFGFRRVTRPGSRLHAGPTMDKEGMPADVKWEGDKVFALDQNGEWKPIKYYRPEMLSENDDEKTAIHAFVAAHRDVGIYTYGHFDAAGLAKRLKGPAVISQFAGEPPKSAEIGEFAARAWRNGGSAYHETLNGWGLYATRVDASNETCVSCHQSQVTGPADKANFKIGDRVGMFVIAVQEPNLPAVHTGG